MESASIREMIWEAMMAGVRFARAEGGQVEREKPGISKVVTVKEVQMREESVLKEPQSPSPEGMRMMCGPEPRCSTCQEIPLSVWTCETCAIVIESEC